jgi:hypothetical protein
MGRGFWITASNRNPTRYASGYDRLMNNPGQVIAIRTPNIAAACTIVHAHIDAMAALKPDETELPLEPRVNVCAD